MPTAPTSDQALASRLNGALSAGPATPEGRARSAANAPSRGLFAAAFALLPGEDPAAYAALLADHLRLHRPAGAVERACVERLAQATVRLCRVDALEALVMDALLGGEPDADEASPPRPLPSLATVIRYRARIARDHAEALRELDRLRALREEIEDEEEEEEASAATGDAGTREPEPWPAGPVPARSLNRAQRRRLAALGRRPDLPAAA